MRPWGHPAQIPAEPAPAAIRRPAGEAARGRGCRFQDAPVACAAGVAATHPQCGARRGGAVFHGSDGGAGRTGVRCEMREAIPGAVRAAASRPMIPTLA